MTNNNQKTLKQDIAERIAEIKSKAEHEFRFYGCSGEGAIQECYSVIQQLESDILFLQDKINLVQKEKELHSLQIQIYQVRPLSEKIISLEAELRSNARSPTQPKADLPIPGGKWRKSGTDFTICSLFLLDNDVVGVNFCDQADYYEETLEDFLKIYEPIPAQSDK